MIGMMKRRPLIFLLCTAAVFLCACDPEEEIKAETADVEVTQVKVTPATVTLPVGGTVTLKSTVLPANAADRKVMWQSSDEYVATVDDKGVVKGIREGNVKVQAITSNGKTGTCTVSVVRDVHGDAVKIRLRASGIHSIDLGQTGEDFYSLNLTGGDPYVFSEKLASGLKDELLVLEFEYSTPREINDLQIFYAMNGVPSEQSSRKYGPLKPSGGFSKFTADITKFRLAGWGKTGDCLRLDPGDNAGFTLSVRNIVVRPMTDKEKTEAEQNASEEQKKIKMSEHLAAYLDNDYPSSVTKVTVTPDKVIVEGRTGDASGTYVLADVTPWQDVTESAAFPYTTGITGRDFRITLDRTVYSREGIDYDRVFSKWAVVKVDGGSHTLDSHARYADEVAPVESPAAAALRNKKGLGAGNIDLYYQDCKEMDCGSITMNVLLNGFINGPGSDFTFGGISYGIGGWKGEVDRMVRKSAEAGVLVSAIILTPVNSAYKDPENNGGYYTMPDMTTAKAFNMYAAALTYMASRYCKDNPGRIHHWIMHNEVDMGKEWTNMGDQPMMRYLDRYIKSMRICYNIVRQYDQNASVLGSYTHNWTASDGGYAPKEMLGRTVSYSKAEGDFRWGVAYHPYPQNLVKPEFWKNDTQATWDMGTRFVTFKNLEVIDKWIRLPENQYKGKKRLLFLSEQGTNSPTYNASDLALQAAGGAWAWKKVSRLDGIDAIQWHNWADNKAEFGLRIGLRSYDDMGLSNLSPKPVWYVWKAAGSADEDSVLDPCLPTLGISSWEEIHHPM